MKTYPHLAARVFGTPLLIEPRKLDVILSALAPRLGISAPTTLIDLDDEFGGDDGIDEIQITESGIAIVNVCGTLVRRATGMDAMSGLSSYADIENDVMEAATNQSVKGILLNVDSYGGEAGGCFDLANLIYQARSIKPVWAIADQNAFSAGYALASSAERLYLTQTSGIGSIGVIMLHLDQSAYDAKEGLKYTSIFAGDRKNDYNPHEPLSAEAKADGQSEVDRLYSILVATVARNRDMSPGAVIDTQAAVYHGEQAVSAGLADGVATFQQVLAEFSTRVKAVSASLVNRLTAKNNGFNSSSAAANVANQPKGELPMAQSEIKPAESPTPQPAAVPAIPQPATASPGIAKADIEEINALCNIAGCPAKAMEFVLANMTPAQVRTKLQAEAAERSNEQPINGNTRPEASTDWKVPQGFSLVEMAKKRVEARKGRAA